MTKRFLSALLAVLMVISLIPVAAFAVEGDEGEPIAITAETTTLEAGKYYKVTGEITNSLTVTTGEVHLEIAENGKLTNKANEHTITVNSGATLTITGSGTVDNESHAKAALFNQGTVNIEGCTFSRSKEAGTRNNDGTNGKDNGNSYYTIENQKIMNISGGTVIPKGTVESPTGSYSSLIRNGFNDHADGQAAILTITGGTFSGGLNTVKNDADGTVNINGGKLTNTVRYVLQNWNIANIGGGELSTASGATCGVIQNVKNAETSSVGKLTISGGKFTSVVEGKKVIETAAAEAYASKDATITGGTFNVNPFDEIVTKPSTTHAAFYDESTKIYTVKEIAAEKASLLEDILTAMGNKSPVDGAPLNDTRTGSEKEETLYTEGTYTVTTSGSDLEAYDFEVTVKAEELKAHQNGATPASMGYWVGVKFPVIPDWTITKYKRDSKAEVTSISLDTDENGKQTYNCYYNVGDASEEVEDPRVRPVEVTYTKGGVPVTVKFIVNLKNVEIMVPAKAPESDGSLSENTQKELTDAITAAATGGSKNDEDTGEADKTTPTVSVETAATSGSVTINSEIVAALKGAAEDTGKKNVDLKIVGNNGVEATIPASTAKELDPNKDLKPTVKAEEATEANATTVLGTVKEESKKATVTKALETLTNEVKDDATKNYIVTVTIEQDTKLFTGPASCEIIVKVPVPGPDYDTVIHIGNDGKVTKEPAEKGGNAENGYFLTVTLNHLSQVFGAKSSEVGDIPVDPGELGAAAMPMVTYTKLADMTGSITGVNDTINKDDVYNQSGVLVVKNTSEATQRYIISVGPKATANSFNIAYVAKLEKNQQYVIQCQQTLAVKVVGVGMTTNLNEKFNMEDFDVDGWVNVTDSAASYPGVTAD